MRLGGGELIELDVLILATGFDAHAYFRPMNLVGRYELALHRLGQMGLAATKRLYFRGSPNFFTLMGLNSPVGNYARTAIAESQVEYVMHWIDRWRTGAIRTVEPTPDAADRFNRAVQAAMPATIWASGCNSWYLCKDGQPELFPWSPKQHRSMLRRIDPADHHICVPDRSAEAASR